MMLPLAGWLLALGLHPLCGLCCGTHNSNRKEVYPLSLGSVISFLELELKTASPIIQNIVPDTSSSGSRQLGAWSSLPLLNNFASRIGQGPTAPPSCFSLGCFKGQITLLVVLSIVFT